MIVLTIEVDCPAGVTQAVKEQIAQELERYGDTKVVSVEEKLPKQMGMFGEE